MKNVAAKKEIVYVFVNGLRMPLEDYLAMVKS